MSYEDQFNRVKRFLLKIDPPSKNHGNAIEYEDNLWSFFQNAWHLKDWIKNDDSIEPIDIETIVTNYSCLMICSDLANRTKHLKLRHHIRVDAKFSGNDVTISINETGHTAFLNYRIIDMHGKEYNAIDLAKEILNAWSEIIDLHVAEIA